MKCAEISTLSPELIAVELAAVDHFARQYIFVLAIADNAYAVYQ